MKSSIDNLQKRGFASEKLINDLTDCTTAQLIVKLNSDNASERTAAVITLRTKFVADDEEYAKLLVERLSQEAALYTKLELCNSLERGNQVTARIMCEKLGKIGNNQHKYVPKAVSKKKSFPLPRDIIARTLGRMDKSVISTLIGCLDMEERQKISELSDAIGYMIFYNPELATDRNFNSIKDTLKKYEADELIVWKIALCCSAFQQHQCDEVLKYIIETTNNKTIIAEAKRSARLIKSRIDRSE